MGGDGVLAQVIDPTGDRAVYRQIADHLRDAIAHHRLDEGEQLPSEAQLMEHYGVARVTIRNALRVLQDEGLTMAEHGRGVYVRSRLTPAASAVSAMNRASSAASAHAARGRASCKRQADEEESNGAPSWLKLVRTSTAAGHGSEAWRR